ncbi:hypothetical protein BC940DRAFT_292104 [Gongronella butleri]|nr:hypothetical protein BC940DRAFT_292104 [Gongronella butleri]
MPKKANTWSSLSSTLFFFEVTRADLPDSVVLHTFRAQESRRTKTGGAGGKGRETRWLTTLAKRKKKVQKTRLAFCAGDAIFFSFHGPMKPRNEVASDDLRTSLSFCQPPRRISLHFACMIHGIGATKKIEKRLRQGPSSACSWWEQMKQRL